MGLIADPPFQILQRVESEGLPINDVLSDCGLRQGELNAINGGCNYLESLISGDWEVGSESSGFF